MKLDRSRLIRSLFGWGEAEAAVDEFLDADRRAVGERVAEIFRWLFLIVLTILNNFGGLPSAGGRLFVNALLAGWAVSNLAVTALLLRGHRPGPRFSLATTGLDLLLGAALVYFSNGLASPYFLGLFLAVIASSVRLGVIGSIASAAAIVFIYLFVGGVAPNSTGSPGANGGLEAWGRVFLFVIVALITGLMAQELLRERRIALSHAAQANALREVSAGIAASLDINDVFEVVLQQAVRMTSADRGRILVVGSRVEQAASLGVEPVTEGEPALPADLESAARAVAASSKPAASAGGSILLLPVAAADHVCTLLQLEAKAGFTSEHRVMIEALTASAAIALANALSYYRRTQEALTDGLTGLLNHREMRHQLELALTRHERSRTPFSLMLIDIDGFKTVNDVLGHQQGDEVLKAAANLVRETMRTRDLVARYGGDELAVVMVEADSRGATASGNRLLTRAREARIPTTPNAHLTFSVGVATCPVDAVTVEELVMAADQALYQAKREGKDRLVSCRDLVDRFESDQQALLSALADSGPQLVIAVAHTVDARDRRTRGRSSRVAAIAEEIALQAGIPEDELDDLRTAALLHDIGLLRLPPEIAYHDWPLTHGTDDRVLAHAQLGEQTVTEARFPPELAKAVRHHHERWDGQGYPDHLAGARIPLAARIIALADAFEAILSARHGAEPPSAIEAFERVAPESGRAFDPHLVDVLRTAVAGGKLQALTLPVEAAVQPAS